MTEDRSIESPPMLPKPVVLALLGDLMLSVRVQATVEALGYTFRPVDRLAGLRDAVAEPNPEIVVYDLTAPGFPLDETVTLLNTLNAERAQAARVLAFFPHVMVDLGRAARRSNFDAVVPRSRFMNDMAVLLQSAMQGASIADEESEPAGGG